MGLEEKLISSIYDEAEKLGRRHHEYHNYVMLEYKRRARRITNPGKKEVIIPEYWNEDRKYNPYYVKKHARQIGRSIARAIEQNAYIPKLPYKKTVPKKGGE